MHGARCSFAARRRHAYLVCPCRVRHSRSVYPYRLSDRNLPNCQLNRLQQIQKSLARDVIKAPKSSRITPILKSLHWLKVNERIEYKLLSLTFKVLTTSRPNYLNNLILFNPSEYPLLICCHPFSATDHLLVNNNDDDE